MIEILDINKKNLKAGNYVVLKTSHWTNPFVDFELRVKILSELKKIVVLDNMLEITKDDNVHPWNFCGEILRIEREI